MKAGRVAQRDLVQREVVGMAQNDAVAGTLCCSVGDLGLVRQVPPGYILAQQFGPAAAIDGAFAHDAAVLAPSPVISGLHPWPRLAHDAAAAGGKIVETRIARSHQRCICVHNQRHAGAQCERAGQEYILLPVRAQHHSLARSAVVHRVLDALGIQSLPHRAAQSLRGWPRYGLPASRRPRVSAVRKPCAHPGRWRNELTTEELLRRAKRSAENAF